MYRLLKSVRLMISRCQFIMLSDDEVIEKKVGIDESILGCL